MNKVFGIGFQKTGTSTLGIMLDKLGYRVEGYHPFRDLAARDGVAMSEIRERALTLAEDFDAFKDTPWPVLYADMDTVFPGSKFVHIIRDPDKWIISAVNDFKNHPNSIHQAIYGSGYPKGNEAAWLARYARHNTEVAEYFADRPDDYLQLRLEDGLTFAQLSPFLGKPVLDDSMPVHANTRRNKQMKTIRNRFKKFF